MNHKLESRFPEEITINSVQFSSVAQSCSTLCDPMKAASQASLFITNSRSSLKLMSIELVIPWSHFTHCCPLLLLPPSTTASESFPMSQVFAWGGWSTVVSALASLFPMKTQDWSPLGYTGWIFLQPKGFSRVLSNTTVQKHQLFGAQPSLWPNFHIHSWLLEKP